MKQTKGMKARNVPYTFCMGYYVEPNVSEIRLEVNRRGFNEYS